MFMMLEVLSCYLPALFLCSFVFFYFKSRYPRPYSSTDGYFVLAHDPFVLVLGTSALPPTRLSNPHLSHVSTRFPAWFNCLFHTVFAFRDYKDPNKILVSAHRTANTGA